MSADDQQFLDVLSSLPNEVQRYSHEVADYINQNVDKIASVIREQVSSSPWIPDSIRSRVPPPTPPAAAVPAGALSMLERAQDWVSRHKIATGVIVLVSGTVAYKVYRKSKLGRKSRRARRARNGGRVEVVVIAGSPTLPLTRSLSLDMERKGFVVYVVCSSMEDEVMVQNLSRPDIKPLAIDIADTPNAGAAIDRFAQFLQSPHSAVPGAKRNFLTLKSVILIPSLNYQTSPIALIPPSNFADLFNTHLLHPILTIQAFLPLLTSRVGSSGDKSPPKVLVFTPSIISSINPPFHAPEATVCSALSAFTEVLTAELRPLAIPVTHIQLGTFDFTGFTPAGGNSRANQLELLPAPESAEVLGWPEPARHVYGRNFAVHTTSAISSGRIRGARGSALRDLHSAVFDVIDGSNTNSVIRIGLGANIYGFVGRWVPRGLVAWMMGIRKVDELQSWQSDPEHSPRSGSDSGEGQEYVTVPAEELRQSWSERR